MTLRMRQICLVAGKLAPVEDELCGVLGIEVCYRDPAVGRWGLENALMPVGNGLLEVVAPVRDGTAAGRYLERRHGDGGYMVILQTDDLAPVRERVERMGIRRIAEPDHDGYVGMQLHPRDTGGAILSIDWNAGDQTVPDGPWGPAGPDWQRARRTHRVRAMTAAELQGDDPADLAERWSEILGRPLAKDALGRPSIALDDAVLRFVPVRDGRGEGLGGLDIATTDKTAVLEAAAARGCPVEGDTITLCGTRIRLI
ncbi:MAG: VOC family protein [Alphaproteobacteria bacterium]